MAKSLMTALLMGAFVVAGIASDAFAEPNNPQCVKAPKDYSPCE
jgi:hypothetical protein